MSRTYTKETVEGVACEVVTDGQHRWAVDASLLDLKFGADEVARRAYLDAELDKAIAQGAKR